MKKYTCSRMSNTLLILKSKIFIAILFCLFVFKMNGQVANYSFSESPGTYSLITGVTAISAGWDNDVTANSIPIGFVFNFNGINHSTCSINSNGYITFGTSVSANNLFTPISGTTSYSGAISALGINLIDDNSRDILYATSGVAPNRVFTVQWRQVRRFDRSGRFDFQIKLNESSNVINIIYGFCAPDGTNGQVLNVQVGLRGAVNTDFNNRSLTANNTVWDLNTSAGTINTATCRTRTTNFPNLGRTFTWAPPIAIASSVPLPICGGSPAALTASSIADYTYSWGPATGLNTTAGSSVIATPATTTTYTVTGTRGTVTTTKNIVVTVNPAPTNILITPTVSPIGVSGCDIDYVKLDASGGVISNAVLYSEDFSAGVATNWAYGGTDTRVKGYYFGSNNAGGTVPEAGLAADAGVWANTTGTYVFQPYNLLTNTTIPINTINYTTLNLSFKYRIDVFLPAVYNSSIYVDVSTNNVNWTNVWSNIDVGANVVANVSVNLNSYINHNQLYFRFRYTGDSYGLYTWYFDDVNFFGDKREISWSPSAGLFTDAALTNTYAAGSFANTVYAAPDSSTNFVASSTLGTCSKTATSASVIRTKKVFTGLDTINPTFWNDTDNWSTKTLPTLDKCVVVPTGKIVEVNIPTAAAKSVTVQSGGKLTINASQSLTVQDEFVNQAAVGDVLIASDGNLIQVNNSAPNSALITAQKVFTFTTVPAPNNRRQYNFVTSPVIDQNLKTIYPGNPTVLYHQESNNFFGNSSGAYIRGRGLAVQEPNATVVPLNTVTANFVGAPFNGILNYPLVYSNGESVESKRGFNLTGNPYPSNLDVDKLFTANSTKISATIQFWDNRGNTQYTQYGSGYNGSNYARYNAISGIGVGAGFPASGATGGVRTPTKIVKAGTGFMVQALVGTNGQTLNFNNAMRTGDAGPTFFGKTNEAQDKDRYWLTLKTPSSMEFMTAVVYFEQGSKDFGPEDTGYSGASDDIFTFADDRKLAIQGRDSFVQNDKINLGLTHFQGGAHTISLFNKEGVFANGQNIYLKDKQTGTITNLTQGSYVFSASAGDNNNRFEIIYEPESVLATDSKDKEQIVVYRSNGDFVIKSPKEIERVEVYDPSGKLLKILQPYAKTANLDTSALINGMYILKIKTKEGEIFNKKILK